MTLAIRKETNILFLSEDFMLQTKQWFFIVHVFLQFRMELLNIAFCHYF